MKGALDCPWCGVQIMFKHMRRHVRAFHFSRMPEWLKMSSEMAQ